MESGRYLKQASSARLQVQAKDVESNAMLADESRTWLQSADYSFKSWLESSARYTAYHGSRLLPSRCLQRNLFLPVCSPFKLESLLMTGDSALYVPDPAEGLGRFMRAVLLRHYVLMFVLTPALAQSCCVCQRPNFICRLLVAPTCAAELPITEHSSASCLSYPASWAVSTVLVLRQAHCTLELASLRDEL